MTDASIMLFVAVNETESKKNREVKGGDGVGRKSENVRDDLFSRIY